MPAIVFTVRILPGDEMKKLEESYNQSQRQWIDDMINACRVGEKTTTFI